MNDTLSPILLKEGDKAPHFSVPDENGTIINLSNLLFYIFTPKMTHRDAPLSPVIFVTIWWHLTN
jgi:hypothetical protein